MRNSKLSQLIITTTLLLASCCNNGKCNSAESLKEAYKEFFPVGVALGAHTYQDAKADSLIKRQFNTITAENCMKPHHISRHQGEYNFGQADQMIEYAQQNGLSVRGHALLWHESAPDWFFADAEDGTPATKELIYERLEKYIHTVVTHFKGKVYCWDVVNEAISDKPEHYFREKSEWYKRCGEEFIEKAFTFAHQANPDALLFYNDYSIIFPHKRAHIVKLIKDLQSKGIPIHGIGMQAHWNIETPTREMLEGTIEELAALGLIIHVTELDVRMSAHWAGGQLTAEDYENAVYEYSPELEAKQSAQYKMIFETFREHSDVIRSVTFWNLCDSQTWLDRRKGNIGRHFPLLFDDQMQPKDCYYQSINF